MSLGIMICNEHGVAFGTDSLLSQVGNFFNPNIDNDISMIIDSLISKKEKGEEVDLGKVRNGIQEAFQQGRKEQVVKSFRSKKLYPMFLIKGKPYGGFICVGAGMIDDVIIRVVRELDKENFGDTCFFGEYIEELKKRALKILSEVKSNPCVGAFIFSAYCHNEKRYICYYAEVRYRGFFSVDNKASFTYIDIEENKLLYPVGDTTVVDRMILGRDTRTPDILEKHIIDTLKIILEICENDGSGLLDKKVCFTKFVESIDVDKTIFQEAFSEARKNIPRESFDRDSDEIDLIGMLTILGMVIKASFLADVRKGASINHMKQMSLRECLKVIKWLIDSTSQFHDYIKNEIPTVGGDVYLATITENEGFVYRNLEDNF